jgi:succinate dehydrogenase/fumarate reductase flavoprotein subunit
MTGSRCSVVVMGSGAAGLAAAVGAAREGAQVTVVEAAAKLGGTTATSGAGIWIPANPWAAADGVEDSPEQALRYLQRIAGLNGDGALASVFVEEAVRVVTAVEESTPLRWEQIKGFPDYNPQLDGAMATGRALESAPVQLSRELVSLVRDNPYHWPPITLNEEANEPDAAEIDRRRNAGIVTRGRGMIASLYATLLDLGGVVRTGETADELLVEGNAIVGVRLAGSELRGEVVVASGGFERNAELVRSFLPGPMTAPAGPPTNRGEMLLMSIRAGAALANMTDAWYVPAMHIPGETIDGAPFYRMLWSSEFAQGGSIIVDGHGRRFMNEAMVYYGAGRTLHHLDPGSFSFPRVPSWFVLDAQRRASGIQSLRGDSPDPEWLPRADSIEELARTIGLPEAALVETVARFNAQAASGVDSDFGRGVSIWDRFSAGLGPDGAAAQSLRPITDPPYYALEVLPGCSGTKGGLRIDGHGRVMRAGSDDFIPGLYAAGNAAAYPFGLGYPGPGAVVGPALVFGWIAGETAARSG